MFQIRGNWRQPWSRFVSYVVFTLSFKLQSIYRAGGWVRAYIIQSSRRYVIKFNRSFLVRTCASMYYCNLCCVTQDLESRSEALVIWEWVWNATEARCEEDKDLWYRTYMYQLLYTAAQQGFVLCQTWLWCHPTVNLDLPKNPWWQNRHLTLNMSWGLRAGMFIDVLNLTLQPGMGLIHYYVCT